MSEFMMQKYLEINNWIESLKREEGQTLTEYALLLALDRDRRDRGSHVAGHADPTTSSHGSPANSIEDALSKLERQPTAGWPTYCGTGQLSAARDMSTRGGSLGCRPFAFLAPQRPATPADSPRPL